MKIRIGSDRMGTKMKPMIPSDKDLWSIFNLFDPAVWIIQDGKEFSPIRLDAYFPEWKLDFRILIITINRRLRINRESYSLS